jgi:ubiquinone/menaquinone biosynthesis C-methylase UbiE
MTKNGQSDIGASDDYRVSHLQRGGTYDATLAAAPFDAYMARREHQLLSRIVPALFGATKPRYLDFACGTGRVTASVAAFAAQATGVDISPSMLEEARRKCPSVRFVHADLTKDNVDLGPFDLITSFRFFGNAQPELRDSVLRTLNRLMAPRGHLIINSHRNPHSFAALLHTATGGASTGMDLTYSTLKSTLQKSGFEIARSYPIGAWMYRFGLQNAVLDPKRAERLEKVFGQSLLTPIAPDAIIVARKRD